MTREDSVPIAYFAAQVRRVAADGDVALRDALRTADRPRDAAARIVADVDRFDLAVVRARLPVLEMRRTSSGEQRRLRDCRHCGQRITTLER